MTRRHDVPVAGKVELSSTFLGLRQLYGVVTVIWKSGLSFDWHYVEHIYDGDDDDEFDGGDN